MSALPPKADMDQQDRFVPKADISELISITRLALVTIRNSRVGTEHTIGSAPRDHSTYGVFSHVPSPGVPGGPQRPKIGQTQILSRRELSLLSCPTLELIEFGSRNAATKNNAPRNKQQEIPRPTFNQSHFDIRPANFGCRD